MRQRITLSLDSEIIEKIKERSERSRRSVSREVEYLLAKALRL